MGARGQTAEEMAAALGIKESPEGYAASSRTPAKAAGAAWTMDGVVVAPGEVRVKVVSVRPGCAAAQVGVEANDQIAEVGGQPVRTPAEFAVALGKSGGTARLAVVNGRDGSRISCEIPLTRAHGAAPEDGDGSIPAARFVSANALWKQTGAPLLPQFVESVAKAKQAEVTELDFQSASSRDEAAKRINDWVTRMTEGKITGLIDPTSLTELTRLVLTNAIYFKGAWKVAFDAGQTRDQPFHVSAQKTVNVPMMQTQATFRTYSGDSVSLVELPYVGGIYAMVFVVPDKTEDLPKVEKELGERLDSWLKELQPHKLVLALPRFRFSSGLDLKSLLGTLGMRSALGGGADFSGIDGKKDLYLSAVVQKAFINVDEKGTEAAAASAVQVAVKSVVRDRLVIDHPCLFVIRDTAGGKVLFLGRLSNPSAK